MTQKIAVTQVELLGGETEKNYDGTRVSFDTLKAAGEYIRAAIAPNAPSDGTYLKTDFSLTFADGEGYKGRLDIKHPTQPENDNDIAKHIFELNAFYAGFLRPQWMSDEQWNRACTENEGDGSKERAIGFLAEYDIPENDGAASVTTGTVCGDCGELFQVLNGNKKLTCQSCQQKAKEAAERAEKQAKREADPLWHVSRSGRTEVTKKIKQLLKKRSGKTWSATGGRGTGYGYLSIQSPPARRGGVYEYMSPADCRELALLVGQNKPIHPQGWSIKDYYYVLRAARGDFFTGKLDLDPTARHAMHVMNNTLEPISFDDLLNTYPQHEHPSLPKSTLDHIMHHYTENGEIIQLADGRYIRSDSPNKPEPTPEPEEPQPAPTPEQKPEPQPESGDGFTYDVDVQGTWTWVSFSRKPESEQEFAFKDALKGLGFRFSRKRCAWFLRDVADEGEIGDLFVDSFSQNGDGGNPVSLPVPAAAKVEPKPDIDEKLAGKLEGLADGLDKRIKAKRETFSGANITHRRARFIAAANQEADEMEQVQLVLRELAALWRTGDVPELLKKVKSKKTVSEMVIDVRVHKQYNRVNYDDSNARYFPGGPGDYIKAVQWVGDVLSGVDHGERDRLRQIQELEQDAELNRPPDFFITPTAVSNRMLDHLRLEAGDRVLEPSAGTGVLVESILEQFPGVVVDCIEIIPRLRKVLELKGMNLLSDIWDFLELDQADYAAIIMNPPFSKGADIDHVRHAYSILKDGGTLVSIMSPGPFFRNDKKAKGFREWFENLGGEKYELPAGSFKESGTGVGSVYVVLEK